MNNTGRRNVPKVVTIPDISVKLFPAAFVDSTQKALYVARRLDQNMSPSENCKCRFWVKAAICSMFIVFIKTCPSLTFLSSTLGSYKPHRNQFFLPALRDGATLRFGHLQ
jgi:hypothetical protein